MYMEQLMNLDFTTSLEWTHLLTFIKANRQGITPKWFESIRQFLKSEQAHLLIYQMKNFYNNINPYIDLCLPFQTNNGIWFSQEFHKHITVGKEIRKRKFDNFSSDQVLVQHYLQLGKNLEPSSVLLPCDQCPLNTHNNKKDNRCLMLMKRDEILQIPVKRSKVSTSQILPNKNKLRIKMPLSDIITAHQMMNETSNSINGNRVETDIQVLSPQSEVPDYQRLDMTIKEEFLNKWFITTDVIIKNLLRIAEKIAHVKFYSVYTDGSKQDFQGCNIMGLGWIIPTSDIITNNIEFRCTTELFPSSTKAEILAIITAIAVAPKGCKVEVFSDSQGAINVFNGILNNLLGNKVKTYDNNIILSAAAQQIIHELELKICLNKVEAHAGIEYNEIADHLAQVSRIAPLQDPRISINSHSLNHVKIIPTWNDLTLEFSIKTMAKKLSSEIWTQKWLRQNRTRWWIHTNKAKNINWELTWKTVHQTKISSLISSFEEAAMRKFSLKLINNELPTLDNLHKRNPLLYTTNTCPFCQIEIENNIHVFTCFTQSGSNPLTNLKEKFIKILVHETANVLQTNLQLETLKSKLKLYTIDFDITNQSIMEFDSICFLDIIAGMIPNTLVSIFKEITGNYKDSKAVIFKSMIKFKLHLFHLWKYRCEKILIWEKSQNISSKDKKLGWKKLMASPIITQSTQLQDSIRVYDDIILNEHYQLDTLQDINYDKDYGSGDIKNSLYTAIFYAKKWLWVKLVNGVSIKGTSRYFKIN